MPPSLKHQAEKSDPEKYSQSILAKNPSERAGFSRNFLNTKNLNINEIAEKTGITVPENIQEDKGFVEFIIKIQEKIGLPQIDTEHGQDGKFGKITLRKYREFIEEDQKKANPPIQRRKIGITQREVASKKEDTHRIKAIERTLSRIPNTDEKAPAHIELTSPKEVAFIGDSNAIRTAWRIKGCTKIGAGGKSSEIVLEMVKKGRAKLKGVKIAIIRVGGNDGGRDPEKYTMKNIKKIIEICKKMGVPEVRILTRQPYDKRQKSEKLRQRSLARRAATFKYFGKANQIEVTEGTRIAVLDAYSYLISDNGKDLKPEFTDPKGRDKLHMTRSGYKSLIRWIAQKSELPQLETWMA